VLAVAVAAVPVEAAHTFVDQTPAAPIIAGDYQRYPTLVGDGTNLALWYENRSAGVIEMRSSSSGYGGFGSATATSGLAGLAHPKVYGGGGGGYVGLFWDSLQSPPNGIQRLTSADGVTWSGATAITIAGSPFPGNSIWGAVGYFEDVSGSTDVLYYTQGTGANEQLYRATATDGVNFTHQGTAFTNPTGPGLGAGVSVGSQVVHDAGAGEYLLIWCGESSTENISFATSADGVTFTQQGTVILDDAGHTDLEETALVIGPGGIVGVYTADFGGDSTNHIGAYTSGGVVPEPVTLLGLLAGAAGLGRYLRRRGQKRK
jgi:hypothetical protein